MLKTRVIPTLLLKDAVLVKTVRFDTYRPIGIPRQAVRVYNVRQVDEMVILDIEARLQDRPLRLALVTDLAEECFMPLAVGGGIRSVEDMRLLMRHGADKVVINTEAFERPALIDKGARLFGSQCIVVSIDARERAPGQYETVTHAGKRPTGVDPVRWAREAEAAGAGEILLTSMDRDGTMQGYDLELIRAVADAVRIPVIASGGAGSLADFADAILKGHASAVAAASIFQFTQVTPNNVKAHMREAGIDVRL
jgi:cyclase